MHRHCTAVLFLCALSARCPVRLNSCILHCVGVRVIAKSYILHCKPYECLCISPSSANRLSVQPANGTPIESTVHCACTDNILLVFYYSLFKTISSTIHSEIKRCVVYLYSTKRVVVQMKEIVGVNFRGFTDREYSTRLHFFI